MNRTIFLIIFGFFCHSLQTKVFASLPMEGGVFTMPMNCSELLPDHGPFTNFFEAVARGTVSTDRVLSKRLFRIMALRDRLAENMDHARDQNPIDVLVHKTLCFYREQKEPVKPIPFDDTQFLNFIRGALKDLELKVDDAVFQTEYEREQRKKYELLAQKNRSIIDAIRQEAQVEAGRAYERLTSAAKHKVKLQ